MNLEIKNHSLPKFILYKKIKFHNINPSKSFSETLFYQFFYILCHELGPMNLYSYFIIYNVAKANRKLTSKHSQHTSKHNVLKGGFVAVHTYEIKFRLDVAVKC